MIETYLVYLVDVFPWLGKELGGIGLWAWVILPISLLLSYILARFITQTLYVLLRHFGQQRNFMKEYIYPLQRPVSWLLAGMVFGAIQELLPLGDDVARSLENLNTLIYTCAVAWMLVIIISHVTSHLQLYWRQHHNLSAAGLIPLFRKLSIGVIGVLALLFVLQNWGFDIAAILAALGIGGIAIALASQKSMENLFGGIMISLDQPIRVGEFGKCGDILGLVTDIGLRSTRIRTLQNTEISIPNSQMAGLLIENFTTRNQILFNQKLTLHYSTTLEQLKQVLNEINTLLTDHPDLDEGARVKLVEFRDGVPILDVWAYAATPDWNAFLQLQEDLLLQFRHIVAEAGTELAIPTQRLTVESALTTGDAPEEEKLPPAIQKRLKDYALRH